MSDTDWLKKHTRPNPTDGNKFVWVDWEDLSNAGSRVGVVLGAQ
jgi:hypothetical protein